MNTDKRKLKNSKKFVSVCVYLWTIFFVLFATACNQLEKSKPEPFYAETAPPQVKEFRWSNGKLPKSFDPAMASAPPETDVVRAVYEGLTDTDAKTLATVPAIAVSWTASDKNRIWTFKLRRDAEWTNGERITARDFARSWKRLAALGERVPHFQLLGNIAGMQAAKNKNELPKTPEKIDFFERKDFNQNLPSILRPAEKDTDERQTTKTNPPAEAKLSNAENKPAENSERKASTPIQPEQKFGVEAIDDFTLRVWLLKADKDFPALVAHPLFRPVYGDGSYFKDNKLNADIVTSGAFRVAEVGQSGVTLGKSETFWNESRVELEKVRFVPMESAEKALEAYRAGEIDAVTNIDFEPLALKLLTPFDDFRRATHSALNFYEFNRAKAPFDDERVRRALAIAVERERLTEDEMDSASFPAFSFLPFGNEKNAGLEQDAERAKSLLAEAGFAAGENFPRIRLVVNRNDMQQRIARAVAKMWKKNLNVETEIVVKEQSDFETAQKNKDYDVLRRGVVLPTVDETVNMMAIFSPVIESETVNQPENQAVETPIAADTPPDASSSPSENANSETAETEGRTDENPAVNEKAGKTSEILTETDALERLPAVPLYFSTSYSLVKSYIQGFEINTLDAPSLKDVRIDNNWQPKKAKNES